MKHAQSAVVGFILFLGSLVGSASAVEISGAGATFPYSAYMKWGKVYQDLKGIPFKYQGIGSGGGIKKITAREVAFGASDKPLKADKLKEEGLFQFPTVVGGVVVVISVAEIMSGTLKLDGQTLADIFSGKITRWNSPAIAALNPELTLPDRRINVIHRSDSSGTTFLFTHYLSGVSASWKNDLGEGTTVPWRVGTGCKTNLLIPICLYRADDSIAYMDYAFAAKNDMNFVQLLNHNGKFVRPNMKSFQAAAAFARWEPSETGFYEILTDQVGDTTWPITGATYILMHKVQDKPETGKGILRFFSWAYDQGDDMAADLGYVPLPDAVQQRIRTAWQAQFRDASGNPLCPEGCMGESGGTLPAGSP